MSDNLNLGDQVRVSSASPYAREYEDVVLTVVGIRLTPAGSVDVAISANWPRDAGEDGWSVGDLVPVDLPRADTTSPVVEQIARAICLASHGVHTVDPDRPTEHHGGIVLPYWMNFIDGAKAALPIFRAAAVELIQAEAQAQDLMVARANQNHEATAAVIHETVAAKCREIIASIGKLGE